MRNAKKILHLCMGSFFADGYAYQENILPKYHKKLGFEVEVIASTQTFDNKGRIIFLDPSAPYYNEYGIRVTRLPYKMDNRVGRKLKRYIGLYDAISESKPDIIFIHGCQFLDIDEVARYLLAHPNVTTYVDNHADFSNSATNWFSKNILHKLVWRKCAGIIDPFTKRFYGVLPARVDFLVNVYKLSKSKCELLVIGGDDDFIHEVKETNMREHIRSQLGISNELLIVTGGKINQYRPEVLNLMEAVSIINSPEIKLVFFGTVSDEYKERFNQLCDNGSIINVGWISSRDTYSYFEAADLVVFPGLHSVMWEQAVAQGKPCIFKDIEGFHHVDIGGNASFIKDTSVEGLIDAIKEITNTKGKLERMKVAAETKGMKEFSYLDIAKRCIK